MLKTKDMVQPLLKSVLNGILIQDKFSFKQKKMGKSHSAFDLKTAIGFET